MTNGQISFQPSCLPERLEECFSRFHSAFEVESCRSESPDTRLWSLSLGIDAAGERSMFCNSVLGVPLYVQRWFALVRQATPWIAPRHGKAVYRTEKDAIMCSFLRRDGFHIALLAVSGIEDTLTVLKHDDFGGIVVSGRNDGSSPAHARVLAAVGLTHETALGACMYQARKMVMGRLGLEEDSIRRETEKLDDGGSRAQWMEEWYDGLNYCTWNGLGRSLTEEKIHKALDDLEQSNIHITNLIIDDNWQSLDKPGASSDQRGWTDFEANKDGFPQGLLKAVTEITDKHPSIDHVAVWHSMIGYWGGISPDGSIAKKYKTKVVRKADVGIVPPGEMTVVAAEDVQRLYDDFYNFLLGCRIDSVKTDCQFFLDAIDDAQDRRELTKPYQDAWTISHLRFFGSKVISCMSQVPQIMFHNLLSTNKPRVTMRNSDDFFPDVESSHPWHIFTNAYSALLAQHLNVLLDWDMFQTSHQYSSFHAAARCVSGGPIYITDEPGKHDVELIRQMTAESSRGTTVLVRPSGTGKTISTGVYTGYEEQRLLKIGTFNGRSGTGVGILGVFNVSTCPLNELVLLHEFPGVEEGSEYIIRSHTTGEVTKPLSLSNSTPFVSLFLETRSWEIFSAYPLTTVVKAAGPASTEDHFKMTPLGLLGKMTGAAALLGSSVNIEQNGRVRISAALKALGILGKWTPGRHVSYLIIDEAKASTSRRCLRSASTTTSSCSFTGALSRGRRFQARARFSRWTSSEHGRR